MPSCGAQKEQGSTCPNRFSLNRNFFLTPLKKEVKQAAKDGDSDKKRADPIPFNLCLATCKWSPRARNVVMWVFSTMQWNCMARPINIGKVHVKNLAWADNFTKVVHDKPTKTDQTGDKVSFLSFHFIAGAH